MLPTPNACSRPAADVPAWLAPCSRRCNPQRRLWAAGQGNAHGAVSSRRGSTFVAEPWLRPWTNYWARARPMAWPACPANVCFCAGWERVCLGAASGAGTTGHYAGEALRLVQRAFQCAPRFASASTMLAFALCCLDSRREAATEWSCPKAVHSTACVLSCALLLASALSFLRVALQC